MSPNLRELLGERGVGHPYARAKLADGAGPVAAFPNPGLPQLVGGHIRFRRDVDHFAGYGLKLAEAGARLVGGCCGTTPAHVRALSRALQTFRAAGNGARRRVAVVEQAGETDVSVKPVSEFAEKLRSGFAVTVEIDLPRGNSIAQVVEAARRLKERSVHAIDILAGNPIGEPPGFLVGASFNPTAEDLDQGVVKLRRKVEAGAHAFWTQPVFEVRALERIGDDGVCILLGLMPLRSSRQAEFLHHEVPGIYIPKHVRQNLAALPPEDAPKYGVEVAQRLLSEAEPLVSGAYVMPPASAPDLAGDVLEAISVPAER